MKIIVGEHVDEVYITSDEEKPTNVREASPLCIMDWKVLSEEQKAEVGARLWLFDRKNKRWLPQ